MKNFLQASKEASCVASTLNSGLKNTILRKMADALESHVERIINQNRKDITYAIDNDLSSALVDRLLLDEKRIVAMANSLREIAALKEPVGRILEAGVWIVVWRFKRSVCLSV